MRWLIFLVFFATEVRADCVVLLHGLARGPASMLRIEWALEREGYRAVNASYPSTKQTIEELAEGIIPKALALCAPGETRHFVTHSMGGILVRQYLSVSPVENLGRVVMLGPPNKGSEIVDRLGDQPGYETINGPAGKQLGTGPGSKPNSLGPATFELGVIAARNSANPFFSNMIPGRDDGKVSVESTKLEGMADHIEIAATHTFMSFDPEAIRQVLAFLRNGRFDR